MEWKIDWTAMIFLAMMMVTMPIFGKAGGPVLKSALFYNKYGSPVSYVDGYGYANISCQTNGTTVCNANSPMKLTFDNGNDGIANGTCNDGVTTFNLPIKSAKFGVYKCRDAGETCEALILRYRTCVKTDQHACKYGQFCFVTMGSDGRDQFNCSIDHGTCDAHHSNATTRINMVPCVDRNLQLQHYVHSMCSAMAYGVSQIKAEQSADYNCVDELRFNLDDEDRNALKPIRIDYDRRPIIKIRCTTTTIWDGDNCSLTRSDGIRMFSMNLSEKQCDKPPFVELAQQDIWNTTDTYELVCHLHESNREPYARLSVVLVVIQNLTVRIVSEGTSMWSAKFVTCEHDRILDDFISECEIELPSGNLEETKRKEITESGEYRCVCRIMYAGKNPWSRMFPTTFKSEPVKIEAPYGLVILIVVIIAVIGVVAILIVIGYFVVDNIVETRWQRMLEAKEALKKDEAVKLENIIKDLANQTAESQKRRRPDVKVFADVVSDVFVGWSVDEFKRRRIECASYASAKQSDYLKKSLPENVIAAPDPKIRVLTVEGAGIPGEKRPTIRADTSVPLDGDPSNRRSWNGNTCTAFYGDTMFVGYVPPKAKEAAFLKTLVMQKNVGLIGIFGMCSAFWSPNPKGFKKLGNMFVKTVATKHDRGADVFLLHVGQRSLNKDDVSFKEICLIFVPYPNDGRAITQTAYAVAIEKMLQMHAYQAERGSTNVAFLGKSGYPDGEMASVVFQTAQVFLHMSDVPLFVMIARLRQSRFAAYSDKYDRYKLYLGTFNVMNELLKIQLTKTGIYEMYKSVKRDESKIESKKESKSKTGLKKVAAGR